MGSSFPAADAGAPTGSAEPPAIQVGEHETLKLAAFAVDQNIQARVANAVANRGACASTSLGPGEGGLLSQSRAAPVAGWARGRRARGRIGSLCPRDSVLHDKSACRGAASRRAKPRWRHRFRRQRRRRAPERHRNRGPAHAGCQAAAPMGGIEEIDELGRFGGEVGPQLHAPPIGQARAL